MTISADIAILLQEFPKECGEPCKMMTRSKTSEPHQGDLFKVFLRDLVDPIHPMVRLADQVDWKQFEAALAPVVAVNMDVRRQMSGWWSG